MAVKKRPVIEKRERVVVFVNNYGWYFARYDAAKQTLFIRHLRRLTLLFSLLRQEPRQIPDAQNHALPENSFRSSGASVPTEVSTARSKPLVPAARAARAASLRSSDRSRSARLSQIHQNP